MNPQTTFTYSGITVSYSEQQKAIVLSDQNLITKLKNDLISYQNEYNRLEGVVNQARANVAPGGYCSTLKNYSGPSLSHPAGVYTGDKDNCVKENNSTWDSARAQQTTMSGYITTNSQQQASAVKKLNDDVATIENDIKIQIQTQIANTNASNAAANAQNSVNTAPAVVAANAAALQTQLANDAESAKLKQEQNVKIAQFTFITILVIVIGYFIIKRVS